MKIIGVNNPRTSYYVGGAEMVAMEHAKAMVACGFVVYFFTINPISIKRKYSEQYVNFKHAYNNKIHFIEICMNQKYMIAYESFTDETKARWYTESMYYNRELYNALNTLNLNFDVLLSYFNLDAVTIPTQKVKTNILYLCGIPEDESLFRFAFLAMYDRIVAITQETKSYWQKYSLQPISVVHTGVDIKRFSKRQKNISNTLRLVFLGRLIERKGCHVLLKALADIPHKILQHICLDIVGDGPSKQKLMTLANKYELTDIVRFCGETSCPEKFLKNSDIAIFPSLHGEGLQGVVLEAMASGLCVIATDTKTNKKLLTPKRGFLIKPNSYKSISKQILFCFNNKNTVATYGKNAHNLVVKKYDWIQKTKQLLRDDI